MTSLGSLGTLLATYVSRPLAFRNVSKGLAALPSGCYEILSEANGFTRWLPIAPTSSAEVNLKAKMRRNFVRAMDFKPVKQENVLIFSRKVDKLVANRLIASDAVQLENRL